MASIPMRMGGRPVGGLSLVHFYDLVPAELLNGFLLREMRAVALRIGTVLDESRF